MWDFHGLRQLMGYLGQFVMEWHRDQLRKVACLQLVILTHSVGADGIGLGGSAAAEQRLEELLLKGRDELLGTKRLGQSRQQVCQSRQQVLITRVLHAHKPTSRDLGKDTPSAAVVYSECRTL